MAIQDVEDLIKQLHRHPEWRDALRREILTEELLSLPQIVRELAEAQRRTEQRVEELAEAQHRTETNLQILTTHVGKMADELGELRGDNLEHRYREHAGAFFGAILRRARALSDAEFTMLVEDALDAGRISEDERNDLLLSDVVIRGRDRQTHEEIYLLVEVSVGIGQEDVERAARRAALLSRLFPTRPVVAGEWINAEAALRCRELGVWQVLDGVATAPKAS